MKKLIVITIFLIVTLRLMSQEHYVLLVIDIQNFYFPGGRSELVEPANAAIATEEARKTGNPVIYIQHKSSAGMAQFLQIPAKDKTVSVALTCIEPQSRFM